MKKTMLAILLMMATTTGFSQLLTVKGGNVKPITVHVDHDNDEIPTDTQYLMYCHIIGEDTLYSAELPEIDISLMSYYFELMETSKGRRLVNNVRRVYPFAKLAGEKMREYDSLLINAKDNPERDRLMQQAEDDLTEQYSEELKQLTISQGLILIRLIDRETGSTSYQVVRELRGKLRAFFYQGFARLWGYNLKTKYDPKNNSEDNKIENLIILLENGQI